jgi:hypothetical protein
MYTNHSILALRLMFTDSLTSIKAIMVALSAFAGLLMASMCLQEDKMI